MKQDENKSISAMDFMVNNGKAEARGFQTIASCRKGMFFQLQIHQNGPTKAPEGQSNCLLLLTKLSGRKMSVASISNATHAPFIFCLVKSSYNVSQVSEEFFFFLRKGGVRSIFH